MQARVRLLLAAGRRFATVLVAVAAGTAAASLLLGLAIGASADRSITTGLYLVGSLLLVGGFFIGNRGPVRRGGGDDQSFFGRRMHLATPEEREETINTSAVFVLVGLALIVIGVLADRRYPLL
jgi:hypothetical protein